MSQVTPLEVPVVLRRRAISVMAALTEGRDAAGAEDARSRTSSPRPAESAGSHRLSPVIEHLSDHDDRHPYSANTQM